MTRKETTWKREKGNDTKINIFVVPAHPHSVSATCVPRLVAAQEPCEASSTIAHALERCSGGNPKLAEPGGSDAVCTPSLAEPGGGIDACTTSLADPGCETAAAAGVVNEAASKFGSEYRVCCPFRGE